MGAATQVVGDDLTVTNVKRIKTAIEDKACNALLLKVNQIGTITESIQANQAERHGTAEENHVQSHFNFSVFNSGGEHDLSLPQLPSYEFRKFEIWQRRFLAASPHGQSAKTVRADAPRGPSGRTVRAEPTAQTIRTVSGELWGDMLAAVRPF